MSGNSNHETLDVPPKSASTFIIPIDDRTPPGWFEPERLRKNIYCMLEESYGLGSPHALLAHINNNGELEVLVTTGLRNFLWNSTQQRLEYFIKPYTFLGLKCLMNNFNLPPPRMMIMDPLPPEEWVPLTEEDFIPSERVPEGYDHDPKALDCHQTYFSLRHYKLPGDGCTLIMNKTGQGDGDPAEFFRCGDRFYFYSGINDAVTRVEHPRELPEIIDFLNTFSCYDLDEKPMDLPPEFGGPYEVPEWDVPQGWSSAGCISYITEDRPTESRSRQRYGVPVCPRAVLIQRYGEGKRRYLAIDTSRFIIWNAGKDVVYYIDEPRGLQWVLNVMKEDAGGIENLNLSSAEEKQHYVEKSWKSGSKKRFTKTIKKEKEVGNGGRR